MKSFIFENLSSHAYARGIREISTYFMYELLFVNVQYFSKLGDFSLVLIFLKQSNDLPCMAKNKPIPYMLVTVKS